MKTSQLQDVPLLKSIKLTTKVGHPKDLLQSKSMFCVCMEAGNDTSYVLTVQR